MPTLALPPQPVQLTCRLDEDTFPALRTAQGTAGCLLVARVEQTRETWYGHSEYLSQRSEQEDPLDSPVGYFRFPVVGTVEATFNFVGKLKPMPVPDLDD